MIIFQKRKLPKKQKPSKSAFYLPAATTYMFLLVKYSFKEFRYLKLYLIFSFKNFEKVEVMTKLNAVKCNSQIQMLRVAMNEKLINNVIYIHFLKKIFLGG